jgi:hypothetical protein
MGRVAVADRVPPATLRAQFEEEGPPLFEGDGDLEVSAWVAAFCVLIFCVLAVGLGVLWLLGVAR